MTNSAVTTVAIVTVAIELKFNRRLIILINSTIYKSRLVLLQEAYLLVFMY